MRIWIVVILGFLSIAATTRIRNTYTKETDINVEFTNIYDGMQGKEFEIVNSTPRVQDMIEGNPIIFSSGSIKFLIRIGTTVYKVEFSTN